MIDNKGRQMLDSTYTKKRTMVTASKVIGRLQAEQNKKRR